MTNEIEEIKELKRENKEMRSDRKLWSFIITAITTILALEGFRFLEMVSVIGVNVIIEKYPDPLSASFIQICWALSCMFMILIIILYFVNGVIGVYGDEIQRFIDNFNKASRENNDD